MQKNQLWHGIPDSRLAAIVVVAVFVAACALAQHYVVHYGTEVPVLDDLTQAPFVLDDHTPTAEWIWSQHSDHRIPLPRILYWSLVRGAHDFRAGTLFDLITLGAIAAAFVVAARKARGRTSLTDAFFPLAWLSWSHAENMLNSFQIVFVLTTAILCACLVAFALVKGRPTMPIVCVVSAGAILLPLCSTVGVVQAPFLAAWLAWVWFTSRSTRESRVSGAIALSAAVVAIGISAATLIGFTRTPVVSEPTLGRSLLVSAQFLTAPGGPFLTGERRWGGFVCALVFLGGLVVLVRLARRDPEQRARWLGLLMGMLAMLALTLSIGFGRGGEDLLAGIRSRYATIALPWACALFLLASACHTARIAKILQWSLLAASAWLYAMNLAPAARSGEERVTAIAALERDVARGRSYSELGGAHLFDLYYGAGVLADALYFLDRGGFAPFRRARGADANLLVGTDPSEGRFREPASVRAGPAPFVRNVDGQAVLLVGAGSELEFQVPADATCARGFFGIPSNAWQSRKCAVVRFVVEVVDAGGGRIASFERDLDAVDVEEDRGRQDFGLAFERGEGLRLRLRTEALPSGTELRGFGWWNDVRLR